MGTRGIFAFKYKGIYYTFYNNYDSYFSCLGISLLKEIKRMIDNNELDIWISKLNSLKIVTEYYNNDEDDISELFYGNIGSYENILDYGYVDIKRLHTSIECYKDDVFIEWMYILDIDAKKVEITNFEQECTIDFDDIKKCNNISEFGIKFDND
jgi:hypothetical protein